MKVKNKNIDQIVLKIHAKKLKALPIAGTIVQNQAKALCKVGKYPAGSGIVGGNLRNSIYMKVIGNAALIGSNVIYAAIQEFGGVITPVYKKALTIPISPEAYGKRAGDFDNLFMLERDGKPPLLVRKNGDEIEPMFVLLKKVEIPKQPYLRPALEMKKKEVIKILQAA